jgi:UDP-N-acetyl-D-glucosamine dehydrogenase
MTQQASLHSKISDRQALVGIIGLGYVGLPLAEAFHRAGFRILGFDIDQSKIDMLARGENYIKHMGQDVTKSFKASGRFSATTDFARLKEADVIIVCVPTPLGKHREPDLSYVVRSGEDIGRTLRPGQLIVLESTTYPGTTRDDFLPAMLAARPNGAAALQGGEDYFVAFSPEREDPGRKSHNTKTTPKLVGGIDTPSGELATLLYQTSIDSVIRVSSAEVAEAAKILENTFRAVNIAMVNELKVLFTDMGIDVWEVINAAATKPFGFMPFYPGPGLGGHCIPIDPFYLTWKAREVGRPTRFIELAGEINHTMPDYVVSRIASALNQRGKAVRGARLLVLGLAYKPDIDDVRESPSFEIIEKLHQQGGAVDYNDPHVPQTHQMRRHDLGMKSVPLSPDTLRLYDAVIISTNHAAYDWQMIADHSPLIIDTRNALRAVRGRRDHIVMA